MATTTSTRRTVYTDRGDALMLMVQLPDRERPESIGWVDRHQASVRTRPHRFAPDETTFSEEDVAWARALADTVADHIASGGQCRDYASHIETRHPAKTLPEMREVGPCPE